MGEVWAERAPEGPGLVPVGLSWSRTPASDTKGHLSCLLCGAMRRARQAGVTERERERERERAGGRSKVERRRGGGKRASTVNLTSARRKQSSTNREHGKGTAGECCVGCLGGLGDRKSVV